MSISRWFYELLEMLNWMEGGEEEWGEFLFNPTITTTGTGKIETGEKADQPEEPKHSDIPAELPILPLRGVVVYPLTGVPLTIGQPRSIKLVDDVVSGNRLVGLADRPAGSDLYHGYYSCSRRCRGRCFVCADHQRFFPVPS